MKLSLAQLKIAMKNAGYKVFRKGDYNLNIIGVRCSNAKANTFNDLLCVWFKQAGQEVLLKLPCTTDPGQFYRDNPINPKGTAVLKTGQYLGCWQLGRHKGQYPALVQVQPMTVWREAPGNQALQLADIEQQTGVFGINCHRANPKTVASNVDKASAGCQVIQHPDEYAMFIALCRLAAAKHGNRFSYTLLDQADIGADV